MGVFVGPTARGAALLKWFVDHPATWWVFLGFGGLLRADRYWTHWRGVVGLLASRGEAGAEAPPPPVNAQEVTVHVADDADRWAREVAEAFGVATVGIFVVDPDDEYVWCLGSHGLERHAYDAGLVRKPAVEGVGYGLTAAWAAAPAVDPRGNPVMVRDLADPAALRERYRDLGFDEVSLEDLERQAPGLESRFTVAARVEAAARGPWVFTAQRLPRRLSVSGRNLVVRFSGRTLDRHWSSFAEQARTSSDRRARQAAVAIRIHEEIVRGFDEGLARWREGGPR